MTQWFKTSVKKVALNVVEKREIELEPEDVPEFLQLNDKILLHQELLMCEQREWHFKMEFIPAVDT